LRENLAKAGIFAMSETLTALRRLVSRKIQKQNHD